ncbi:MAG TPA: hypothetical protein DDY68_04400 [Porphyromonadaceae bacterium]|nr:hypothetical protein [Porphyromonadaceae bacterium]
MNRYLLLCFFVFCSFCSIKANLIDSLFVHAPFEVLPNLSYSQRIELMELSKAGKSSFTKNILGDTCRMEFYSPTYLRVKLSHVFTFEIKLIEEREKGAYFLVNETCCAPACDSYLSIYDEKWKLKKMKNLTQRPKFSDFLKNKEAGEDSNLSFSPLFIRADVSEKSDSIIFHLDAEHTLCREEWKEWKDKLNLSISRPIGLKKK